LRRGERCDGGMADELPNRPSEACAPFPATRRRLNSAAKPRPSSADLRVLPAKLLNQAPFDAQLFPAISAGRQMLLDQQAVSSIELSRSIPGKQLFGFVVGPLG
jgi:hypothetical protein